MTEIRARDLRFTSAEARQFLDLALNLSVADAALRTLDERTEGWAVGLQLAAVALQRHPNPAAFIEFFRGSHRYILDYLAEEVIRQQGEEVRVFLTQTSILERFNAAACSALTGRSDSQSVIVRLEQANLFIIPLDDERCWYRYHRLFADYLRSLLSKTEESELYRKASAWHAANDMLADAVRYALASRDPDFAAGVIGQALKTDATWSGGNLAQWLSWLESLPAHVFDSRPQLSLQTPRAFSIYQVVLNRQRCASPRPKKTCTRQPEIPTAEREQMLALVALYRGSIASVRGDFLKAVERIGFAQERLAPDNHLAHARAYFALGLAYENADQSAQAAANYLRSAAAAQSAGVLFLNIHAICSAAQIQVRQGRLQLAAQTCRSAIDLTEGALPGSAWVGLLHSGGIALERNELDAAEKLLQDGIALSRQGGLTDDLVLGLAFLARLRAYRGDAASAHTAMQEFASLIRSFGIPRMDDIAAAYQARLDLILEDKHAAALWARQVLPRRVAPYNEYVDLTLARVLLAAGELDALPMLILPLLEKARTAGRLQACMEALLLLALYHHTQKDMSSAQALLEESLQLAAPEGYLRLFLDAGPALLDLLPRLRAAAPDFVDSLLNIALKIKAGALLRLSLSFSTRSASRSCAS